MGFIRFPRCVFKKNYESQIKIVPLPLMHLSKYRFHFVLSALIKIVMPLKEIHLTNPFHNLLSTIVKKIILKWRLRYTRVCVNLKSDSKFPFTESHHNKPFYFQNLDSDQTYPTVDIQDRKKKREGLASPAPAPHTTAGPWTPTRSAIPAAETAMASEALTTSRFTPQASFCQPMSTHPTQQLLRR